MQPRLAFTIHGLQDGGYMVTARRDWRTDPGMGDVPLFAGTLDECLAYVRGKLLPDEPRERQPVPGVYERRPEPPPAPPDQLHRRGV